MSHSVDGAYDVYHEQEQTARKQHECDACELPIAPGQKYTRVYWLFEGRKESIKRCSRCQFLHEHLREKCEPGEQWPAEQLDCGLRYEDEWGKLPPEIAALAFWLPGDPLPATNPCLRYPALGWESAVAAGICWRDVMRYGRDVASCTVEAS